MPFSVMLKHQELVVTITKGVAPGQTETAWFQGSGLGCPARDPPGYGASALACADCLCWKIGAQAPPGCRCQAERGRGFKGESDCDLCFPSACPSVRAARLVQN